MSGTTDSGRESEDFGGLGRPTWAEINLGNLRHNLREVRHRLTRRAQLMAVVKADAYGHGAVKCARVLEDAGADWFGVALPEEGYELRAAGVRIPILCTGGFWRGQAQQLVANEITPAIFRPDMLEELHYQARDAGRIVECHLKIDTGMGRLGLRWDDLAALASFIKSFEWVRVTGLLTHFAAADASSPEFTQLQMVRFEHAYLTLTSLGFDLTYLHQANSAALHAYPEAQGTLSRAGAALYGLTRDVLAPATSATNLRPVMSLHSRIIMLKRVPARTSIGYGRSYKTQRESTIATIPVGYADGLPRQLSNRGQMLVRGRAVAVVGRISMDLTTIDVTDVPGVDLADEVVLLGSDGGSSILAEDIAATADTISYEIVSRISRRVPRYYRP